ncbi:MAG: hypothetical protein M1834_006425 [Cirrosporium novae-zelandiae]|nr:MAG: hypothetical protein M1834_006425 [Cirrosporium novae-zelandiae]
MAIPMANGSLNGTQGRRFVTQTVTGLKRWSCGGKDLPPVSQIKHIHIYDFDNTLFLSPLPSPKVWVGPTLGHLQSADGFTNGGWWHDSNILAATGEGIDKEEPRAWKGWWNETIVDLVQLSMRSNSTLNVLLTGRSEGGFADLIKRMIASKELKFDMVCLKPEAGPSNQRFTSTMMFKQTLLEEIVNTYREASDIRVYEDRPKHVQGFRKFFETMNEDLSFSPDCAPRGVINAEVIEVAEVSTTLDPITEVAEVQRMINSHNLTVISSNRRTSLQNNKQEIKKVVSYTGYLISESDSRRLIRLVDVPENIPYNNVKYLANNILISVGKPEDFALARAGPIGKTLTWKVTGVGSFKDRIWAARVESIPEKEPQYTYTRPPTVILAHVQSAKPFEARDIRNFEPVDPQDAIVFETVIGEKVLLKVGHAGSDEGNSSYRENPNPRKHPYEQSNDQSYHHKYRNEDNRRGSGSQYRGGGRGRGGGGSRNTPYGRGGRGGSNRGGRGRRGGYRSLDDVGDRGGYHQGYQPSYGDGGQGRGHEQEYTSYDGGLDGGVPTMNY